MAFEVLWVQQNTPGTLHVTGNHPNRGRSRGNPFFNYLDPPAGDRKTVGRVACCGFVIRRRPLVQASRFEGRLAHLAGSWLLPNRIRRSIALATPPLQIAPINIDFGKKIGFRI